MATRSFIAKKVKGGYIGIYSHWDGYPTKPGVGWTLRKYYKSPSKVTQLIALGDISVLGENIGKKHDFDKASRAGKYSDRIKSLGYTTAYHRDRGEAWSQVKPKKVKTLLGLKKLAGSYGTEYLYVYENGKWTTFAVPSKYW